MTKLSSSPEDPNRPPSGVGAQRPKHSSRKRSRNLVEAATLRPREVHELYGMPETTVSDLCNHSDPEMRIDSYKIPGRQGRKGSRYIDHASFRKWLARWRCAGGAT
jgi:hypothetical protein